jgi:hypothetical protein
MPEGSMQRHDWIFDMLSDLLDYALANGLPDLAASVTSALAVARREVSGGDGSTAAGPCPALPPRMH